MKKLLSLVLAASMLATMAVTSFAADTEPTDDNGIMLLGGAVDNPNGNDGSPNNNPGEKDDNKDKPPIIIDDKPPHHGLPE